MIRRGGGRAPPVILIGLLVILVILGFNYWLLLSQNADLQQELEKLQSEVKISVVKQDQSEKKNAALQETVHEMDEIADKLKKRVEEEKDAIKTRDREGQKKDYEITLLKNKIVTLQEQINTVKQQVEEQEVELAKAKETNSHLSGERDAALEAVGEKDTLINTLKRQLEQAQDASAAYQREQRAVPKYVPGAMNIPGIEKKEAYFGPGQLGYVSQGAVKMKYKGLQGMTSHRGLSILPQDPPDAIRPKPRFSVIAGNQNPHGGPGVAPKPAVSQVKAALQESQNPQIQPAGPAVVERPAPPVAANNQPLAPPANVEHEDIHNEVLAPPPVQGDHFEGRKDNGNFFEPHGTGTVAAKPDSLQDTAKLPDKDRMAIGLQRGHADTEDKNDAQEQLDELPQLHGHVEAEGEDHNNALEQVEDEGEDNEHQRRLPREP